jgi:hypothetical protein
MEVLALPFVVLSLREAGLPCGISKSEDYSIVPTYQQAQDNITLNGER